MKGAPVLSKRSNFFPLVPEILELPCLQTSPPSGRRDTFKYRESTHQPLPPSPLSPLEITARGLIARTRLTLALAIFSNKLFFPRFQFWGRELQGSFLNRPRPSPCILAPPYSRLPLRYEPAPAPASCWSQICLSEGRARARPRPVARWCHLGRERGCACTGPKAEGHQGTMAATASPGAGRMDGKPRTSPKSVKFLFGGLAG